ncbi:ATP-binding protein [bacterium]|nr:ATP-binding protein [bacterium]
MLLGFSSKNYKAFDERVSLDLAPITLLFGKNHAGKSALLRLLPFLADSFHARARSPLNFDAAPLRGAGFSDILCNQSSSQTLELELRCQEGQSRIQYRELEGAVQATRISLLSQGHTFEVDWIHPGCYQDREEQVFRLQFQGPVPSQDGLPEPFQAMARSLHQLPRDVLWLEASREPLAREIRAPHSTPWEIGSRGERAIAFCSQSSRVTERVSGWYRQEFGLDFEIRRTAAFIRPVLTHPKTTRATPLSDSGEGFSQVLPVVTAWAMAHEEVGPKILCLEHPELHLHPDAHPSLARLFLQPPNRDVRLLVETHSENLLL